MKRLILTLARLYPRSWRRRYGDEFEALLEDSGATWRGVLDVLRGALMMHMNTRSSIKTVVLATLIGLLLGAATSFLIPVRYSSAVAFLVTVPNGGNADQRLNRLMQFASDNDQSVQALHQNIKIERLRSMPASDPQWFPGGTTTEFSVEIRHVDRPLAEKATRTLATDLVEGGLRLAERDHAAGLGDPTRLQVVQPVSVRPDNSLRRFIAASGVLAGFLIGLFIIARPSPGGQTV
jgi:hypothetical protein